MPIKFSLRMSTNVNTDQPFIESQVLEVRVLEAEKGTLLQASRYGDSSTDYRIDLQEELYITNFHTSKEPAEYIVEVWLLTTGFKLGSFGFITEK